tara:strand:- start:409 stop:837 length:429 start_codon:yes stop_codon:yes gene_type:complete
MKNVYEIFEEFVKAESKVDKVFVLQNNVRQNRRMTEVLQGAMHPNIQFVIKNPLEYNPSLDPPGLAYSTMESIFDRIYLFTEGSTRVSPALTLKNKEVLAIQILEGMEAKEANVFMNMLMKDLKVPGLTPEIVEEAFPGLLH